MNNSNNDSNKVESYSRLSPEDEKTEDKEFKARILSNLNRPNPQLTNPNVRRNGPKRTNNNDCVITVGVCPVCDSKLRRIIDRYGSEITTCEKYEEGCRLYTPYKVSHFKSAKDRK